MQLLFQIGQHFILSKNYSTLESKSILSIGRFTKQKGFDILISFIAVFFEKNPDWKLTLIGEGPLKNDIEYLVKRKGLENNIKIKEPTNYIEKEYLKSSIYIMTSKYEGFPMVLLEAKAFGLPIIAFDCPTGPSEIIRNGEDGFLIEMFNTKRVFE